MTATSMREAQSFHEPEEAKILSYTSSGIAIMGGSLLYYILKKGKRKEEKL